VGHLTATYEMSKATQAKMKGDQCLKIGDYDEAIKNYYEALGRILLTEPSLGAALQGYKPGGSLVLPDSVPFNKSGFIAFVSAGMSAAFAMLDRNTECINAADVAIGIFKKEEKTFRIAYPITHEPFFEKWTMSMQLKGVALAKIGYLEEALEELNRVKKMVIEEHGGINSGNMEFLEIVNTNIDSINDYLAKNKRSRVSKFWKRK
jgi:hypothetical protein